MRVSSLFRRVPSVLMAWRNLGRSRVRTALATLGIVIGVVAIASLGMAGAALQQQATADLEGIANEVQITVGEDNDAGGIEPEDVDDIRSLSTGAEVVPEQSNHTTLASRDGQEMPVSVTGVTEANVLYDGADGELPDRLRSGALLTDETADQLGLEPGDPIEFDGQLYRLEGLIETEQGFRFVNNELVLPPEALSSQTAYDTVTVVADDGDEAQQIASAINERFNEPDDEQLRVESFADTQDELDSFMTTLNLALLGIGSISLIVASVAILNVMLMSTIERRGEIGVLRAVGIRRGEVLRTILIEALLIGVLGGLLGALCSLAVGLLIFRLLVGDAMAVFGWASLQYLVYGFAFAVVASVLSGLYPAWKAANDRPVDALRG